VKVLFVCPFVPWPLDNGGKTRTYQLLRAASRSVELELFLIEGESDAAGAREALEAHCTKVRTFPRGSVGPWRRLTRPKLERWFHSPALTRALREELRGGDCDLLHLDELLLARVPPRRPGVPVVQHHHKLDTVYYSLVGTGSLLERAWDLRKLERLERLATRRTKHHVLCSREDAQVLTARHGSLDVGIVPSGFDHEVFSPGSETRDPDRLLFLGSMDYAPNVDAVRWFVTQVLPRVRGLRPATVLDVVGGEPTRDVLALAGPDVVVHGRTDDVVPWLRRCAAMVVPLRIGGGTRLKIAEALGVGTPTVSTTIGAEGLALVDREHLALADTPTDLARRTLELLDDPAAAASMGARGRVFALEHLTWVALGERLVDYWKRVATPRTTSA